MDLFIAIHNGLDFFYKMTAKLSVWVFVLVFSVTILHEQGSLHYEKWKHNIHNHPNLTDGVLVSQGPEQSFCEGLLEACEFVYYKSIPRTVLGAQGLKYT